MAISETLRARLQAALTAPDNLEPGGLDDVKHEDLADFLAEVLGETEALAKKHLKAVALGQGRVFAFNLLRRALQVEREGGLLTKQEPQRRRSPGGAYFQLAKDEKTARKRRARQRRRKAKAPAVAVNGKFSP